MGEQEKTESKVNELTSKQQGAAAGEHKENAADHVFSEFREHSVAEFFKKNRQMLGFSGRTRSLTTIVHEYVTNSLDAAEEARIAPEIFVKLDLLPNEHYKVTTEDNGVGIPRKHIGKALAMMLAGTKFHRYMQQRGQQGIGASGCTMFAQITTGTPIKVMSGIGDGRAYECELSINLKTNEPVMTNFKEIFSNYRGLRVEAEFAEVKYDKSDKGVYEYLRRTAMANPHAQITFVDPFGEKIVFPRASDKVPVKPREILPHPLGITTNDLVEMARHSKARKVTSFLMSEFSRVSSAKVKELDEMLNQGKGKDSPEYMNFEKKPSEMKWHEAERLIKAFQTVRWIAPETSSIIPIGEEQVEKALTNILNPEFIAVRERSPKVFRGGVPFTVECAIAFGGNSGRQTGEGVAGDIMRFANRAPLLFDGGGCAITEAVKTIDWKRYDVKDFEAVPLSVFVNFVSVYVPYTGAGKQAISPEEEIITEIRYAVMEVARQLQQYVSGKLRDHDREGKRKAILRYVSQLSVDLPELAGTGKSAEIKKKLAAMVEKKYASSLADEEEEKEEAAKDEKPNGADDVEEEEE